MTATDDTCSLASHLAGWVAGTRQCSVPATPTMLRMSIHAMHVAAGPSPASLTTPRCAYDRHRRVVPKGYAAPPRARPFAAPDEPPQLSYPVPGVGHTPWPQDEAGGALPYVLRLPPRRTPSAFREYARPTKRPHPALTLDQDSVSAPFSLRLRAFFLPVVLVN